MLSRKGRVIFWGVPPATPPNMHSWHATKIAHATRKRTHHFFRCATRHTSWHVLLTCYKDSSCYHENLCYFLGVPPVTPPNMHSWHVTEIAHATGQIMHHFEACYLLHHWTCTPGILQTQLVLLGKACSIPEVCCLPPQRTCTPGMLQRQLNSKVKDTLSMLIHEVCDLLHLISHS